MTGWKDTIFVIVMTATGILVWIAMLIVIVGYFIHESCK